MCGSSRSRARTLGFLPDRTAILEANGIECLIFKYRICSYIAKCVMISADDELLARL